MTGVFNAPPYIIDGPRPIPPKYRLLDTASIIDDPDPHWMAGAQVWGYPPDLPLTWDPCSSGTTRDKAVGGAIPLPDFGAFVAYLAVTCTARSIGDDAEYVARALAAFNASESFAVERAFSQGEGVPPDTPFLADTNADLTPAGAIAVSPRIGLSYLLDAIGATGRQGMIHATPGTVSAWGQFRTYHDAERLYTTEGTPIAEGQGYLGATPIPRADPPAGQAWAYATGPVDIRRSQPIVYPGTLKEAFDRSDNTVTYRVERTYLADWDQVLQAAVLIDWKLVP